MCSSEVEQTHFILKSLQSYFLTVSSPRDLRDQYWKCVTGGSLPNVTKGPILDVAELLERTLSFDRLFGVSHSTHLF